MASTSLELTPIMAHDGLVSAPKGARKRPHDLKNPTGLRTDHARGTPTPPSSTQATKHGTSLVFALPRCQMEVLLRYSIADQLWRG